MSAVLLPQARQRYYDNDGFPLSGGKLYTYDAGTSTPKAAYQNSAGTVPHSNPIILDAKGEAVIYWAGAYKVDLYASDDTQVTGWPVDNVNSDGLGFLASLNAFISSLASSTGATLVGYGSTTVKAALDTLFGRSTREPLTGDRTYYVRTDGSDSNNGLANTAGGAFLTKQKAIDVVMNTLDLNGHNVTIQVGNGSYGAGVQVLAPWVGKGTVALIGNTGTPSLCTVSISGLACFYAENGASLSVSGFKVVNSSGEGVYAQTGAKITVGPMEYGACANSHVTVGGGGFVNLTANYTVTGGGTSHLHAGSIGAITSSVINATLIGTPNFSSYFAGAAEGTITCKDITFSGAATGPTHLAHKNGVIDTHPAFAALPGNVAGRQATGGSLIGSQTTPFCISPVPGANNSVRMQSHNVTTNLFTDRFVTESQPTGAGGGHAWAYVDGDDSFMSGRTHIGCPSIVLLANANDGTTFTPATAAFLSQTSQAAANFRRNGTDGAMMNFYKGGASAPQVGSITVTGSATAFNTSSDYRLKDYIGPIEGAWARVKATKTADYVFKSDERRMVVHGFIAHELAETYPLAVTGVKDETRTFQEVDARGNPVFNEDGSPKMMTVPHYQGIDPSKLIGDLFAATQEAQARIEMLEEQIKQLQGV